MYVLSIILLILFVVIIAYIYLRCGTSNITGGGKSNRQHQPTSKFEQEVRRIFERVLPGYKFPTVNPQWLRSRTNTILEFDGYNEELGIAFEVQGPLHYKYNESVDKNYRKYYTRIINDLIKQRTAAEHNVHLITVDYILPRHQLTNYIKSRLYDITLMASNWPQHKRLIEHLKNIKPDIKPADYIPALKREIYRNPGKEKALGLDDPLLRAV